MTVIDSQVHAYEANTPKRPWATQPNWPPHVTGEHDEQDNSHRVATREGDVPQLRTVPLLAYGAGARAPRDVRRRGGWAPRELSRRGSAAGAGCW